MILLAFITFWLILTVIAFLSWLISESIRLKKPWEVSIGVERKGLRSVSERSDKERGRVDSKQRRIQNKHRARDHVELSRGARESREDIEKEARVF